MAIKIIAEIGNNHNGNLELAKNMAAEAIASGADIIKFQIYDLESFISPGNEYYDDFKGEALSFEDFALLKKYVEAKDGHFLATPFDAKSLDFLHQMGLTTIKIASGDFDNFDLLEQAVEYGMKLIISLGGAEIEAVDTTVDFLKSRNAEFTLLHCVLSYPAAVEDVNLSFIETLRSRYNVPIGYSDHTEGIEISLGAIALGAEIIEKHFTTDRSLPGGDNEMSILPDELRRLCVEGRNIEKAIGKYNRVPSETEAFIKTLVQRIYFAKSDIPEGQEITHENIHLLRPNDSGVGFFAAERDHIYGKIATRSIKIGEVIDKNVLN